jgi:ATP-binding cassette, subfamily C, bacterial
VLDYLRSATLVVIADRVGRALSVPVLRAAVRRGMHGDSSAGAEALRDLNEIRSFLGSGAVSNPLDAICTPFMLAVMFLLHPAFGWLGVAGISVLMMVGIVNDTLVRPATARASADRSRAGHQLSAGLNQPELTEGLGMFPAIVRRWARGHGQALAQLRDVHECSQRIAVVSKIVRLGMQSGVMAMGAVLIISRQASAGSLMGANLLLAKVLGSFDVIVSSWRRWIEAWAAWQRIGNLLADETAEDKAEWTADEQGLVLKSVGFSDPKAGRALLSDISLALPPGTATALLGPNGAGKSTLLRVIVGLLPPSQGQARLDGMPIAGCDRRRIGYLPQGVHLLDGSITDNIARFEVAPADIVIGAAQAASVHDIIGRLKQGYETRIGQAAASLSGGQKQQVGLARALFAGPRLLVLDEPDASLDQPGEQALLAAIDTAKAAGAIVVVATHRPKLLARMDHTLTLGDGRAGSLECLVAAEAMAKRPVVA